MTFSVDDVASKHSNQTTQPVNTTNFDVSADNSTTGPINSTALVGQNPLIPANVSNNFNNQINAGAGSNVSANNPAQVQTGH